jgi:hypothetical protein
MSWAKAAVAEDAGLGVTDDEDTIIGEQRVEGVDGLLMETAVEVY